MRPPRSASPSPEWGCPAAPPNGASQAAAQLKTAAARSGNVRPTATVVPLRALRASESGEALPNTVPITARTSGSPRAFLTDEARLHAALDCLWLEADPKEARLGCAPCLGRHAQTNPRSPRAGAARGRVALRRVKVAHPRLAQGRAHGPGHGVEEALGTPAQPHARRARAGSTDTERKPAPHVEPRGGLGSEQRSRLQLRSVPARRHLARAVRVHFVCMQSQASG